MVIKRIISDEKRAKISGSKIHKGKNITTMSDTDKEDLLKLCAEKLGLL